MYKKIAGLILAAGESSRFGSPKQIIPYKNTTMLNHIKEHLTLQFVDKTFVVLGAYAAEIIKKSGLKNSEYILFEDWKRGMGSSMSYACKKILEKDDYNGLLFTLSDLPLVTRKDYKNMVEMFESVSDIVVTQTNNYIGVPAIFGSDYFDDLLLLEGDEGAKKIINRNIEKTKKYLNSNAALDIDTAFDAKQLKK